MPAVADQPLDPPSRRLAIEPAPPGERGGLEQAIEGRPEPGEDQRVAMPGLERGECEVLAVSPSLLRMVMRWL